MAGRGRRDLDHRRLIAAVLTEAERHGWQSFQMREAAQRARVSAARLRANFAHKEDAADAWLAEADEAMLGAASYWEDAEPRARLAGTLLAWLDHLAPHRRVAAQIFAGRLYPFHPHDVVRQILWMSRTVQWWREAAGLDAPFPRRQAEEVVLTWIFAATVARWSVDASPGQRRTRDFLARALRMAGLAARATSRATTRVRHAHARRSRTLRRRRG